MSSSATCSNCSNANATMLADMKLVLAVTTRLETKMDTIVGTDGTGGRLKAAEDNIAELQLANSQNKGMFSGAKLTTTGVWAILLCAVEYYFHRK